MPKHFGTLLFCLAATTAANPIGGLVRSNSRAQPPRMTAVFDLVNHQSGVLPMGSSHIVAVSAWAGRVAKEPPYGVEALEIEFFTAPLTAGDEVDLTTNSGRKIKKHDYAAFVIFLDKDRHAAQVNMTFVVPGSTVTRTVAYTATKLKGDFSDLHFDGKRVQFKSNAKFEETDDKNALLSLAWNVDLDLPVVDRPPR